MDDPKQKRSEELQRDQLFEGELDEILERLGIAYSEEFNLILHNDSINEMLHVVLTLSAVCGISIEKATYIMKIAHYTGCSIILNGVLSELRYLRLGLQSHGLTVSIEHAK